MLRAKIKIGDAAEVDTQEYGLVYLDSDKVMAAPTKGFEETSYPEQSGTNISPKTVDDAFDYTAKFFIQATSLANANHKIKLFNQALYTQDGDVKTFKQVEFTNIYKRHKIVGYPKPISEAEKFWRDPKNLVTDVVVVEFTIRVNKPALCNFDFPTL